MRRSIIAIASSFALTICTTAAAVDYTSKEVST